MPIIENGGAFVGEGHVERCYRAGNWSLWTGVDIVVVAFEPFEVALNGIRNRIFVDIRFNELNPLVAITEGFEYLFVF